MKPFPSLPKRDRPREISIQGIPDPWLEYLVLEDVDKPSGSSGQCRVRCNSFDVTRSLWRDYGISLEQGIPNYKITILKSAAKRDCRSDARERETDEKNCKKEKQKESSCQPDVQIISPEEKKQKDKKSTRKSLTEENFPMKFNENALITEENINWVENSSTKNDEIHKKYFKRDSLRKQSKIVKVMKGIFRRWRRDSKRISNDLSKFDDNFVCYHCNCPYFKVCKSCSCSGAKKTHKNPKEPRKSDDSGQSESRKKIKENSDSQEISKKNKKKYKNSRIENDYPDEDIPTSQSSPIIESNEIHSSSNSAFHASIKKMNDKKTERIGINSRISLNSRNSSERMKKIVNDCFPRELKTSDERVRENRMLKSVETSENENSSLQTEFAEIQKFESNFMGRGADDICEGDEEGKKRGELEAMMENDWLFAARNFGRFGGLQESKREFNFGELQKDSGPKNSESVKILYEGLSRGQKTLNNLQIDNFLVEANSGNLTERN